MSQASNAVKRTQRARNWKRIKDARFLYLMLLLPVVYFVVFKYGAITWLFIAFKKYNAFKGIAGSKWVGFSNFEKFMSDPYFWKILWNTIYLNLLMLVFSFPIPIVLALMINDVKNKRFQRFTQSVTYLPYFLSTVIVCGFIVNVTASDGLFNTVRHVFGLSTLSFMSEPSCFRPIYVISEIWQYAGWGSIVYLAALTGVDAQLYEAASIDGASKWRQLISISIPCIAPVISIQFLLTVGRLLSVGYEKIILLYNGSTYSTADVISTYVYRRGLINADYSYGAAVSLFQSVVALMLVVMANKTADKIGQTNLW
jgi:putative aldouronate transport system permease protein